MVNVSHLNIEHFNIAESACFRQLPVDIADIMSICIAKCVNAYITRHVNPSQCMHFYAKCIH